MTARPCDRTIPIGKDERGSAIQRERLSARLGPGALLDEQRFPTFIIAASLTQQAGELKRKRQLTINVLVKAVVTARLVAKQ